MHCFCAFCNVKAPKLCLSQSYEIVMILMVPDKKPILPARLKSFRAAAKMSQKKLGSVSGVSYRSIQNAEAGISDLGSGDLVALAEALNVSVDEMVRDIKPDSAAGSEKLREVLGYILQCDDADLEQIRSLFNNVSDIPTRKLLGFWNQFNDVGREQALFALKTIAKNPAHLKKSIQSDAEGS